LDEGLERGKGKETLMATEKALQIFTYKKNEIRTVVVNGEIYFVASDVCTLLELGNVSQAVSRVKEKHKTNIIINDVIGRSRSTLCINEPGLYHLLFTSRKPEAEAFQDWVYEEVLPSIRKTGSYSIEQRAPQKPAPTLSDALRQRAFLNEKRVPPTLFSTQCEFARELHYVGDFLDASLDYEASLEASVGRCFSSYIREVLPLLDTERCKYRHQLPSGRVVDAWAYPIGYLPHFRRWLYTVYFPVKFPAYQEHRSKRLGGHRALKGSAGRMLLAARGVEQLALF
jgi:prophage antirepressor-like protein